MRKTVDQLAEEMLGEMTEKEIREAAKITLVMSIKAFYSALDKLKEAENNGKNK